uniref:Ig-like domain-containing protein n=1 Tax=Xiphophorus couchianus TaxID=32473 RepID=A0A3B5L890_9TELE
MWENSLHGRHLVFQNTDHNYVFSLSSVPPELSVPKGQSQLIVLEGDTVDLQCLVSGKPKPIIMWSRVEESGQTAALAPTMPDGSVQTESYDGILRIYNVTRKMSGAYRCQTSQYNGFNVKPREALIHLVVQFTPTVKPVYTEVRQALGRAFSLTCNLLEAYPAHHLQYEWKLGSRLLTVGQFSDQSHDTSYHVKALNREGYGEYTCDITNKAGTGRCTFLLTGDLLNVTGSQSESADSPLRFLRGNYIGESQTADMAQPEVQRTSKMICGNNINVYSIFRAKNIEMTRGGVGAKLLPRNFSAVLR